MINLKKYKPNEVLFWTGAGISMEPPSCLPSGYRLTKDIVDAFCLERTWDKIERYLLAAKINDASGRIKEIPRLESILGSITSVLGYDFLKRFDQLFDPDPNFFHYFFAHHILLGGGHVTLNLDIGIENAIQQITDKINFNILTPESFRNGTVITDNIPYIFYIHGKKGDDLNGLGLTIENISKGLPDQSKQFLLRQFKLKRLLVIAGYSGSDVFDVNPFFDELRKYGKNLYWLNVVWIDHSSIYKGISSFSRSINKNQILNSLSKCGANCYIWSGTTKNFFNDFIKSWKIPKSTVVSSATPLPSFDKSVANWQSALATAKVFVSMGLGNEAHNLLTRYPIPLLKYKKYSLGHNDLEDLTPKNRIIYLYNESLRERGLYKEAAAFTKKIVKNTELDSLLFFERKASDSWLSGRLFLAKSLYLEAIQYGIKSVGLSTRFDSLYIECIRGYMQVCRDISYLPLIGKYFARKYLKVALKLLLNKKLIFSLKSSPYDMSHITRMFLWELDKKIVNNINIPDVLTDESNIINVFSETDNLLGYINTFRSSLNNMLSESKKIKCDDALHLFALSRKINNYPGIVKASMILASVGFLNREILKSFIYALYRVQWTYLRKIIQSILFVRVCIFRRSCI